MEKRFRKNTENNPAAKTIDKNPKAKEFDSWENFFFVNDTFFDERYNEGYKIKSITESQLANNPKITLLYEDGTERTETATGLKYLFDNNQHYKHFKFSKEKDKLKAKFNVGDIVYHNMRGNVKVVNVDLGPRV